MPPSVRPAYAGVVKGCVGTGLLVRRDDRGMGRSIATHAHIYSCHAQYHKARHPNSPPKPHLHAHLVGGGSRIQTVQVHPCADAHLIPLLIHTQHRTQLAVHDPDRQHICLGLVRRYGQGHLLVGAGKHCAAMEEAAVCLECGFFGWEGEGVAASV